MGNKVTFTVDAKHEQAIAAFLQVQRAVDLTAGKGAKAGDELGKAGNAASSAWDKGLKVLGSYPAALTNVVTGTAAVYAVISQVRAEFERIKALQDKAMTSMDAAGDPYYRLKQSVEPDFAKSKLLASLTRTGMENYGSDEPRGFLNLAASMESARGQYDQVDTMKAANAVASLRGRMSMPDEDAASFGGALLDALNVQKAHGKNYTPEQVAGKFLSMYGVTRSTSMQEFAKYDMRTVNALAGFGFSMDESIGFQGALAGTKPDPTGRITATGMGLFVGDIAKAYTWAHGMGMGMEGVSPEQFEKSGMKMFEAARSETPTGDAIQAYLFGQRARTQGARDTAFMLGDVGFMGHARGESGFFELARELLDPRAELFGRAREASSRVASDADAEARFNDVVSGAASDPHDIYYRRRADQRGAIAVGKWENLQKASQGGVVSTQAEISDLLGRSALGQSIAGSLTAARAAANTPEDLRKQELGIYQEGIDTVRGWAAGRARRKAYGPERDTWLPEFMNPVTEEQIDAAIPEQEQGLIDLFRRMIERLEKSEAPASTDSSMIDRMERLIDSMANMTIRVDVSDGTGRMLSRTSSRPRALELLDDAAIG